MKELTSLKNSLQPAIKFLARFHYLVFFLIIGSMIAVAMFTIAAITSSTSGQTQVIDPTAGTLPSTMPGEAQPQTSQSGFDQETIDALSQLSTADGSRKITFPEGRINPFVE